MDSKVCVASLLLLALLSSAHGAVIHSEVGRVFQKVQDVLVNPDTFATALGMRVKRDTGDWDKEFDLEALGLSFKIKYVDPSNPLLGGHAYLKFPGHRFVKAANFDDVELKLEFKGGNGQLKMKIEYKFIQKFRFFADRPQQGVVTVGADYQGNNLKLMMSLERNATKEFEINAAGMLLPTKVLLDGKVILGHDNVWEMLIDLSFTSINVSFIQNGLEYSVAAKSVLDHKSAGYAFNGHMLKVDVEMTYPGHRHSFQVENSFVYQPYWFIVKIAGDFNGPFGFEANFGADGKTGKLWLYNGDKTYALVDLVGDFRPKQAKYDATYTFMDGWPQFKTEGQANINYDELGDKKQISIYYTEISGKNGNINVEIEPTYSGLKYLMDITHDGKIILRQENVRNTVTDSSDVEEITEVTKTEADETSPFYKLHCYYVYPVPCTSSIQTTRKYTIYTNRKANFTFEEETLHGAEKFSFMKIDTSSIPYSFTWEVIKAPAFYPFEGKIELTAEPNQNQPGIKSMFKFERDGKTIVLQNVDSIFARSYGRTEVLIKVDHQLDDDFYKLNKWFGSLIHPVPQWKKGTTTFMARAGDATLDIKLDSLNYIFKMRTYASKELQTHFIYNIPVAPEWCPLEGEFSVIIRPLIGIAVGGSSPSHSMMAIGANTTYTYKHEGTTYLEGEHYFLIDNAKHGKEGQSFKFKKFKKIAVHENSSIYAKLCGETYPLNCSNVYDYETRLHIDSRNTTMDLHLETKQDGETAHLFKIDAMNKPYQLIWSQPESSTGILKKMFGIDRFEVTADYEAGKELTVISNVAEMNLILRKEPNLFMELKRYGETYLKFSHQKDQGHLALETLANLYIPSGSIFCVPQSYFEGCYNKWEGELKVFVDLKNKNVYLNKHSINAFIKKDMEVIFEVEQSTNVSPYVLKIKSPHLMDKLFDDPHKHSLDLTVDHQEGKLLHIQTNHPKVSSFKIIDQSKLELNGKELVDYNISDKQLTVTYQLAGGERTNLQLIWNQWMNPKNQGSFKIGTSSAKFNLEVDYDVTDVKNGHMMMNVHGENPKIGKYDFLRKVDWNVNSAKVAIAWDGKAQLEKGPLAMFSPIDTKGHVEYDVTNMILTANIDKDIAGQKWRFEVTDNKVSLSSQ